MSDSDGFFLRDAIDFPTEDVVVGALRAMRDIDEDVIRLRWRTTEGRPLGERVSDLLCNNGPEWHVIMNTLRAAGCDS
jgi:hypothetical protein